MLLPTVFYVRSTVKKFLYLIEIWSCSVGVSKDVAEY